MKVEDDVMTHPQYPAQQHSQPSTKPKIKIPEKMYHSPQKIQDRNTEYQMKAYRPPIGTYPGMYDRVGAGGYTTTTTQYDKYTSYPAPQPVTTPPPSYQHPAPQYSAPVTPVPPAYPAATPTPAYTPAPVYTPPPSYTPAPQQYPSYTPAPPQYQPPSPPQVNDRSSNIIKPQQQPSQPLKSFYNNFASFGGQHPKPYQPAITFLDVASAERRKYNVQPQNAPENFNNFNSARDRDYPTSFAFGSNHGSQYEGHDKSNYDPFTFGQERQERHQANHQDSFQARSIQSVQGRSNQKPDNFFSRPDDTIYTPAADPKKFFDNQFHASDRFFDMKTNFNQFDVTTQDERGNPGETLVNNQRRFDDESVQQSKHGNKRVKTEDKLINMRSKLFDSREPGGYYIKVFNNDGNNYAIRDGNIHKGPGVNSKHRTTQSPNIQQTHQQSHSSHSSGNVQRNIGAVGRNSGFQDRSWNDKSQWDNPSSFPFNF